MRVVRCDAEAVILEDAVAWGQLWAILAGVTTVSLLSIVAYVIDVDGLPLFSVHPGLLLGSFACSWFYGNVLWRLRFGDDPALARLRFAAGRAELTGLGRVPSVRYIEFDGSGEWYVLTQGATVAWKREPNAGAFLEYSIASPATLEASIRNAVLTMGNRTVETTALSSGMLYTIHPYLKHVSAVQNKHDTLVAKLGTAGSSTAFGDDRLESRYFFTVQRRGKAYAVISRHTDNESSNTLMIDPNRRFVRIQNYPQLQTIGGFEYLAFFRSESSLTVGQYGIRRLSVKIDLLFKEHYPIEVFSLVGPISLHPEFDGHPLEEEAKALCVWLNEVIQGARIGA